MVELSESLKFYLLVGQLPPCRLWGWLDTMFVRCDSERLTRAWTEHKDELVPEAQANGFEPGARLWFDKDGQLKDQSDSFDDEVPDDPARDRWAKRFCTEHKY